MLSRGMVHVGGSKLAFRLFYSFIQRFLRFVVIFCYKSVTLCFGKNENSKISFVKNVWKQWISDKRQWQIKKGTGRGLMLPVVGGVIHDRQLLPVGAAVASSRGR